MPGSSDDFDSKSACGVVAAERIGVIFFGLTFGGRTMRGLVETAGSLMMLSMGEMLNLQSFCCLGILASPRGQD